MIFFASSCPITYSSRNFLISCGLINLKLGEKPASFLLFFSSPNIWLACVTHLSQMWACIPEIIRSTSFLLLPQNEHVTSAITLYYLILYHNSCPLKIIKLASLRRIKTQLSFYAVPKLRQSTRRLWLLMLSSNNRGQSLSQF